MRRIFTKADLVVADIGEAGDDFDDVATVFNALMNISKTTAGYEQIDYERYEMFGLPSYTDQKWESWRIFLARPWFRRVWIMQEYALASNVNMMYGTLHLHGEAIPGLIPKITQRKISPRILDGGDGYLQQHTANISCAAMSAMLSARRDIEAGRSRGLLHYLRYLSSFCEATDKRDKVYALLGLATDAERSALHVNYSESTVEVYHRTAKLLIEQGSGIQVLYEAACYTYLPGLPSWAPNWAGDRALESLGSTTGAEVVTTFRATGSASNTIQISADSRLLHVRGIYLDSIEAINEPLEEDTEGLGLLSGCFKYLRDFIRASRALVHRYENTLRYPPGQGLENSLWRTLICDMTRDVAGNLARPAPSSFASSYHACLWLLDFATNADPEGAMADNYEAIERIVRQSQPFITACEPSSKGRRFCVTRDGYMGLVPARASKGDDVCVFLGGTVPFLTRKTDGGNGSLVGECYIHGLMDGEALDVVLDFDWMEEKDISLK
ncbi:hypothetical protein MMC28_008693 [Mycoblastus sanguinarius]|nr:hypothetical protein [Mycoblastus sanguinarius]